MMIAHRTEFCKPRTEFCKGREEREEEPQASGSGWVPLSPPPYPVNAQGRANCRYRGQPRAKEDERERGR